VAVVYDVAEGEPLPPSWRGHEVLDGDLSDYRFLDESPRVIGLRVKTGPGRHDTTGFVLREPFPL